jgi:N-acetylglutamate synthase-like GNAT family acetyltransferase
MEYRILKRDELVRLKEIDRSEIVEKLYYLEDSKLVLKDEFYDVKNDSWINQVEQHVSPRLYALFDRGGTVYGAFDKNKIIGMAALESKFIGKKKDQLQLYLLYVSKVYRKCGVGKKLMQMSMDKARLVGAKKLYISATPSQNTVDFYLRLGCQLTSELNPELFELEPEDIHLELKL